MAQQRTDIEWYYLDVDNESKGPISTDEVKELPSHFYVWNGESVDKWTELRDLQSTKQQNEKDDDEDILNEYPPITRGKIIDTTPEPPIPFLEKKSLPIYSIPRPSNAKNMIVRIPKKQQQVIACPCCSFDNDIKSTKCEICLTPLKADTMNIKIDNEMLAQMEYLDISNQTKLKLLQLPKENKIKMIKEIKAIKQRQCGLKR